jgi:DNA-binding XRE family transcriptional regulator
MIAERPNHLREYRHDRLLTQSDLAALAGVTPRCVSNIETGYRAGRWRTRRRLAAALGHEVTEVFPDERTRAA